MFDLRTKEQLRIHCGKKHFKALDDGVDLMVATNWKEVKISKWERMYNNEAK